MNATISYTELDQALKNLKLEVGASDLHGSLTGYLCANGRAGATDWPSALELDIDDASHHEVLGRLYPFCRAQLSDPEFSFEPLLPEQSDALGTRADALVEWCRGFIGGVGLAGTLPLVALSEEVREILHDFAEIARANFECTDAEEDESAMAEILEFVRVGALLLHSELAMTAVSHRLSTVH